MNGEIDIPLWKLLPVFDLKGSDFEFGSHCPDPTILTRPLLLLGEMCKFCSSWQEEVRSVLVAVVFPMLIRG
jgi:hypothetical protein